jgi:hypothetical protein
MTTNIGARLRGLKQEKGGLLNDAETLSKSQKPEDITEVDSKLARVRGINAEIKELEELIEKDRGTLAAGAGAIEILPRLKQSACGPEVGGIGICFRTRAGRRIRGSQLRNSSRRFTVAWLIRGCRSFRDSTRRRPLAAPRAAASASRN